MKRFPDHFQFGASTAAYQIEGAVTEDGRGESIWDRFAHTPGKTVNGEHGDTACDHYHRWEEDLDMAAAANMSVYRFSIAWPRLFPDGTGARNEAGFDFYKRLIAGCHARGLEPWPCLYHWDMPQALEDRGGWTNRDMARWYADYAEAAAKAFGNDVPALVLFNEPSVFTSLGYQLGIHAPGRRGMENFAPAIHHVNLAAAEGARRVRAAAPNTKLGNVIAWAVFVPASDSDEDAHAAKWMDQHHNTGFVDPHFKGRYADLVAETVAPFVEDGDVEAMKTDFDFIGINHYIYSRCSLDQKGRPVQLRPEPGVPLTQMGWQIHPRSMTDSLTRFRELYGEVPLWVTENGVACPDDQRTDDGRIADHDRVAYLKDHIGAVHDAIEAGVDMRGYLIWTLMDNFEWAVGYDMRFGLVETDYDTLQRRPKLSYDWYADLAASRALGD
ncbi:MAG: GH1 family beta-glucosidase [Pseudomonadota bacterium]